MNIIIIFSSILQFAPGSLMLSFCVSWCNPAFLCCVAYFFDFRLFIICTRSFICLENLGNLMGNVQWAPCVYFANIFTVCQTDETFFMERGIM